jgi:hypothetical protein
MQYGLGSTLTCVAFCGIIVVANTFLVVLITAVPVGQKKENNANTVLNICSPQIYTFDSNSMMNSTGSFIQNARNLGFLNKRVPAMWSTMPKTYSNTRQNYQKEFHL